MESLLTGKSYSELAGKIINASEKLILLDFDGTIVDFKPDIAAAVPSDHLLKLLGKISGMTGTKLVIITGRRQDDIDRLVGHLRIDIVAEHGAMIRENMVWKTLLNGTNGWKKDVLPVIHEFCSIAPGTFLEEKHFSVAWHFRNLEYQAGKRMSRLLVNALKNTISKEDLKILEGGKVVEIIDRTINKGAATLYILERKMFDLIISIGDGKTDEDMFRALLNNSNAYTVKIGQGITHARYRLNSISQVITLLEKILESSG